MKKKGVILEFPISFNLDYRNYLANFITDSGEFVPLYSEQPQLWNIIFLFHFAN